MPSAEFDIIFETPTFNDFNNSAKKKKHFVELVAKLFKDENTFNIVVLSVSSMGGKTKVTWYNKTLDIDRCDEDKILQLRQVCNILFTIYLLMHTLNTIFFSFYIILFYNFRFC